MQTTNMIWWLIEWISEGTEAYTACVRLAAVSSRNNFYRYRYSDPGYFLITILNQSETRANFCFRLESRSQELFFFPAIIFLQPSWSLLQFSFISNSAEVLLMAWMDGDRGTLCFLCVTAAGRPLKLGRGPQETMALGKASPLPQPLIWIQSISLLAFLGRHRFGQYGPHAPLSLKLSL